MSCRLCDLAVAYPNIGIVLEELGKRGLAASVLVAKVKPIFVEVGAEAPTARELVKHQAHNASEDGDYETDYIELRSLYAEFRVLFDSLRKDIQKANSDDVRTSDYRLQLATKLAGELRSMLKTLSDMRNDEKLFNIVLLRHTETLVHLITGPLGRTLRELHGDLQRGDAPAGAARLAALLEGELYPLFETAGQQALAQSKQQFKLN